jgi:hypothetical protein
MFDIRQNLLQSVLSVVFILFITTLPFSFRVFCLFIDHEAHSPQFLLVPCCVRFCFFTLGGWFVEFCED